ncbi:hypothetical protein [Streptomyces sp. NPDC001833]|uniref:hypothetical protein n=1 Tax=Streptomyces sp. NPDC001833 TaxID=3154658 RepID=UPI00331AEF7E
MIPVDVDTHITGVLEHHGGVLSTKVMSFDAVDSKASRIEVHGERGSLIVPDPNNFLGDVAIRQLGSTGWEVLPVSAGYRETGRDCDLADLALATPQRPPRASGQLAHHVLRVMERLLESAHAGTSLPVTSSVERPEPVPLQDLARLARGKPVTPSRAGRGRETLRTPLTQAGCLTDGGTSRGSAAVAFRNSRIGPPGSGHHRTPRR